MRIHGDRFAAPGLLDLAVNVWPGPRPPFLVEAMERALRDVRYPDEGPARAAVAARHGRPAEEVLLTNGACDAFWLLAGALRPARAACVHPSFTEPDAALRAAGACVAVVPRERERWTFDPGAIPNDAEVVVLGNPNNPTGTLTPRETVRALVRPGRLVVVDESFVDFAERESLAGEGLPGLVVVRSLTKLWALPGVRAGYLLGPADLVAALTAARQPWSVNAVACAAIAACAGEVETASAVAREVAALRDSLLARLRSLPGLRAWPSAANFVLCRVPDGPSVVASLRDLGVAVRPAGSFPGLDDDFIRVAVRDAAACDTLVDGLAEALG